MCVQEAHTSLPAHPILISAHASSRNVDEIDPNPQEDNEDGEDKSVDPNKGSAQLLLNANTSDWRKNDADSMVQGKSSPPTPDHLGTLDYIPSEHLDEIANDENEACYL